MRYKAGRKLLGVLLALALVIGQMSGMSLTVRAVGEKAYAAYDVTTDTNKTKRGNDLTALQVTFNERQWYIIEDNSTSATSGTVTLLSADTSFGTKKIADNGSNKYSTSQVKAYLDSMTGTGGDFADVADAIETVNLTINKYNSTEVYETVNGVKLYLLSYEEANSLPTDVRKAEFTGGDCSYKEWWLRSPGSHGDRAACVRGAYGTVLKAGSDVEYAFGVRPALKLNLSSVSFSSESKEFTVGSATVEPAAHTHNDINFTAWTSTNSMPTEAGNYYLANDVTLGSLWNVPEGTTNLCLNGHAIKASGSHGMISVGTGVTLNLYDEGEGEHKYIINNGLAVVNDNAAGDAVKTFTGGYITGGYVNGQGAAVLVSSGGIFHMYGGTLIGNRAYGGAAFGGAVSVQAGHFEMHDGKIIGNYSMYGAVDTRNGGDGFIMRGGEISYNTATYQG
ncbi:MAG: hypothetical protein IKN24_04450, partial [Lachnospiraceae bacterium]|nr:hypothetical protein [Lachnospiraceae bacterium]